MNRRTLLASITALFAVKSIPVPVADPIKEPVWPPELDTEEEFRGIRCSEWGSWQYFEYPGIFVLGGSEIDWIEPIEDEEGNQNAKSQY